MPESFTVSFAQPFKKPPEGSSLVVLMEYRPAVPERQVRAYLKHSGEYASAFNVYLATARFIMQERLCMCLFSPDGKPLLLQKATHLNLLQGANLQPENTVLSADTPLGRVSLSVDVDIFHPEVSRAMALRGAEIIISSQYFDSYDLTQNRLMSGGWSMAQQNGVIVIGSTPSSCYVAAPAAVTGERSGFLMPFTTDIPAFISINPEAVREHRISHNVLKAINPELCSRHKAVLER